MNFLFVAETLKSKTRQLFDSVELAAEHDSEAVPIRSHSDNYPL
jgi:hypothetical protein